MAIDFNIAGVPVKQFTQTFQGYWKLGLGWYSWGLHVSLISSNGKREWFKGKT